jgi:hypothetical protein
MQVVKEWHWFSYEWFYTYTIYVEETFSPFHEEMFFSSEVILYDIVSVQRQNCPSSGRRMLGYVW